MRRLTVSKGFIQTGRQKAMVSPITGKLTVYTSCRAIAAAAFFEYDMNALKTAYNQELQRQGVDAQVQFCKKIRGLYQDNLITDLWVAAEGPIPAAVVALIIFLIKVVAVSVAAIVILSAASAFVETVFPKSKFYAPDGTEFTDLAAYLTYMRNWNTGQGYPYTCMYCGQGFKTEAERDAHQANCPWKGGPPTVGADVWMYIVLIVAGIGAVIIIPKVIDIAFPKKAEVRYKRRIVGYEADGTPIYGT